MVSEPDVTLMRLPSTTSQLIAAGSIHNNIMSFFYIVV